MVNIKRLIETDWKTTIKNYFLVVIGSILLAIGTGVFLLPALLNTGGMMGLGIISQKLFGFDPDIVVLVLTWCFFFISLLFLGWRFTLKSLVSSLVYPLVLILLMRISAISSATLDLFGDNADVATKLIAGVFGGVFSGAGVALTFLGGGSTGGVDILVVIINKYLHISHSILAFALDALIIVLGIFIVQDILLSLVGVISAFVFAITLEFVFGGKSHVLCANIISATKSEEINKWIIDKIGRGTTLVTVNGGYNNAEYTMIILYFDRSEYARILNGVARLDKKAFVTIQQATKVLGEGFNTLVPAKEGLVNFKKHDQD